MTYSIEQSLSDSGEKVYIYVSEDRERKVPLNSLYSPCKEAERFVKKYQGKKKVFVLVGIGNGAVIKKWAEAGDFIHLYIIEPFRDLPVSEDILEFMDKNPNITFSYYNESLPLLFGSFIVNHLGTEFEIVLHPHYEKTDVNYLQKIVHGLRESLKIVCLDRNTELLFQKDWVIEPLINLEYTMELPLLEEYKGYFAGQKAVLVASGPSLQEHIETVKRLQNGAYVFAAGSAMNGLINHGIVPDFVTCIDSGKLNYETHFRNSSYRGPMIIGSMVNSQILRNHKGSAILVEMGNDHITQRVRPCSFVIPSVPSVSVFTLLVIYHLGFNEIYLVGQDLALVNGRYYAEGVHEHPASRNVRGTMYVENNMGKPVATNNMLFGFLQTFNYLISLLDPGKIRVFNLSKHGAKIAGVPYISPEKIMISPINKVELKLPAKKSSQVGLKAISRIIEELKRLSFFLKETNRKLQYIREETVSIKEMKRISKLFSNLRKESILEEVIIQRYSFMMSKLKNLFGHTLDKSNYSQEDLKIMVKEIKNLVNTMDKYVEELLADERMKNLEENVLNKLGKC